MTIVGPCLTANDDGTYGVGRGFITPDLGLFDSVHDAVAVAVRELPSGLGPVTLGSFLNRPTSTATVLAVTVGQFGRWCGCGWGPC
ncbi:DUF6193 family natural product biosynthesis protein [Streptomyces sp. SID486]|uniref:DUF6193 family natural product biosynthesis protein n=1 Tax=Streptomyces sp. SID486 TaxID=2690264 RepID=UPI0031F70160